MKIPRREIKKLLGDRNVKFTIKSNRTQGWTLKI